MIPSDGDAFARSAYTIELFHSPHELEAMQLRLLKKLGADHALNVRFIADRPAGSA
jgi:hypothetical protein